MISELILSTIILATPSHVITHEPKPLISEVTLEHNDSNLSDLANLSNLMLEDDSEYTEFIYDDYLPCGYKNILSFPVYDSDDNLVTLVNVMIYDKYKPSFNMDDGKLFLADISLLASRYYVENIPLPALLAQAYTEGGAGKAGVYLKSNNLFGLRAGPAWDGFVYARDKGITYDSYETAKAHGAKDLFRAYMCMDDSIADYIDLVQTSSRYHSALGKNSKRYLKALVENGYGNPEMLSTWLNIIKLYKLDK